MDNSLLAVRDINHKYIVVERRGECKKYLKRTGNATTVTLTNVKKGTWYVTIRAWNQTSKDKSRVYSPYSSMKKFKTKKSLLFLTNISTVKILKE